MPPTQNWIIWGAIGLNALRIALQALFGSVVLWIQVSLVAAVCLSIAGTYGWMLWRIRKAVRLLRQFDADGRGVALSRLEDESARAYLEQRLASHGAPQIGEVTEQFQFSPVDRREFVVLAAVTAAATIPAVAVAVSGTPGVLVRFFAIMVAMTLVAATALLVARVRSLERKFEVSAFGFSEVTQDGSVQRIYWGGGVQLRNRPWLQRIELSVSGAPGAIKIPYRVVGFDRLVDSVLKKGGFIGNAA
jgi:hypothetical protein